MKKLHDFLFLSMLAIILGGALLALSNAAQPAAAKPGHSGLALSAITKSLAP